MGFLVVKKKHKTSFIHLTVHVSWYLGLITVLQGANSYIAVYYSILDDGLKIDLGVVNSNKNSYGNWINDVQIVIHVYGILVLSQHHAFLKIDIWQTLNLCYVNLIIVKIRMHCQKNLY